MLHAYPHLAGTTASDGGEWRPLRIIQSRASSTRNSHDCTWGPSRTEGIQCLAGLWCRCTGPLVGHIHARLLLLLLLLLLLRLAAQCLCW
jgi:hypothetical protein